MLAVAVEGCEIDFSVIDIPLQLLDTRFEIACQWHYVAIGNPHDEHLIVNHAWSAVGRQVLAYASKRFGRTNNGNALAIGRERGVSDETIVGNDSLVCHGLQVETVDGEECRRPLFEALSANHIEKITSVSRNVHRHHVIVAKSERLDESCGKVELLKNSAVAPSGHSVVGADKLMYIGIVLWTFHIA